MRTLLERERAWEGTASELLMALLPLLPVHAKHAAPRSPKALGDALRRLAPNLRGVLHARQRSQAHAHRADRKGVMKFVRIVRCVR